MFSDIPLEKLHLYQIIALCAQASLNCYKTLRFFFDEHPIDEPNNLLDTPFLEACKNNAYDSCLILIEHGANRFAVDRYGNTALHLLRLNMLDERARAYALRVFKILTEDTKKINAKNLSGETALHCASIGKDMTKIEHLLRAGADRDSTDNTGQTAMHYCVESDFVSGCEALVEWGANILIKDMKGLAPLHCAVSNLAIRTYKFLLLKGANVHDRTFEGNTALHLIPGGCSEIASTDDDSYTQEEFCRLLFKKDASLNAQNNDGNTPLHMAVLCRNTRLTRLFLQKKASATRINKHGKLPLHLACTPPGKRSY